MMPIFFAKRIWIFLSFVFLAYSVLPQAWQRINPKPFECSINDCKLLQNGRLIACGSHSNILVSDNFGESWEIKYQPGDLFRYVDINALCFIDNMNGWAVGSYQTIIRTYDGGESWSALAQGFLHLYPRYLDIEFVNDSLGFVISDENTLYRTTDGGVSWISVISSDSTNYGQIQFVSENVGYISGSNDHFLKTTDGGISWTYHIINPPIENFICSSLCFLNVDTGVIGGRVYDISSLHYKILKTENGGLSWYEVFDSPYNKSEQIYFINADTGYSIGPVIWYSNNILRTIDGGNTWEEISDDIGSWKLNSVVMENSGIGFCLGDNGQYFKSNDFGASWTNKSTYPFLFKQDVLYSEIIHGSEILAYSYGGDGGVPSDHVLKSYDKGESWVYYDSLNAFTDITFINDSIGFYLDGTNKLYRTSNGGLSWNSTAFGNSNTELLRLQFINDTLGFLGGTKYNDYAFSLYKTGNCGLNWIEFDSDYFEIIDSYQDFGFFDDSNGIIVGMMLIYPWDSSAHILRTHDQGLNWEMDTLDYDSDFIRAEIVDDNSALLFGWGRMCKTIDKGNTWYQLNLDYSQYIHHESVLAFGDSNTAYLTINGPSQKIFRTDDVGEYWYEVECPTTSEILSMSFLSSDEGLIFGRNGTIFKTYSGGVVSVPDFPESPDNTAKIYCYPNPFCSGVTIKLIEKPKCKVVASVYNLQGKVVNMQTLSSGTKDFHWNGHDDFGQEVTPGIYILQVVGRKYHSSVKIIKI